MQTSQQQSQSMIKKQKTKQQYSRNVKKLKFKLQKISNQIQIYQKKISKLTNTSNDQIIAMKISKFCKQRKFTPQMLFRFADINCKNVITRTDFRNTLISIGLKLSQQQLTRLQYLLDQDIKGDISLLQYSKYLHAFGLKNQHNPNDPYVKQTLKDIDFNKLLQITKDDQQRPKKKDGLRTLLTYQQFLKYCHKHCPDIKDKQLAKIFKKLSRDQKIDLDDFIDYIQGLKKEQQRINNKNKQNKQKNEQKQKGKQVIQIVEQQQQKIDITTLKGKLMAILKQHPQKQQTFHSSQFKRVQQMYKLQRGSMLNLFRQMDTKLVGSVGFNQIIFYYVDQQTYKPNNDLLVKYSFILMGKKMTALGQKPQALLAAFAKQQLFITAQQFVKMCNVQFGLRQQSAKKLYDVLLRCPTQKIKQNTVNTALIISLMKINRGGSKNNIKPILADQYKKFFYKKHYQTICTNGIVVYKICQSIVNQLAQSQKYQKWDDFQFGPTTEDQYGFDSISRNISNPNIKWHRTSNLGMKQFYLPSNKNQKLYEISAMCENDLFYKSLQTLVKYYPKSLNRNIGQIVKNSKKVQESQLIKLFEGLHPLVFQRFQQRGIYVIQFYIQSKWVYVIVDDKIPCNQQNKPLFSKSANGTCSYFSLIQKAYAKLKGSYEKIFQFSNFSKYIHELSSILSYTSNIQQASNQNDNKQFWNKFLVQTNMQAQKKQLQKIKQLKLSSTSLYLANQIINDKKARKSDKLGLQPNNLLQIYFSTQIKDDKNPTNIYNLTLLNCPYQLNSQEQWNPSWNQKSSKFKKNQALIKAEINKWDNQNQVAKIYKNGKLQTSIIDQQTLKQTFNSLVTMVNFKFDDQMIILRKYLEFQKNFSCLYKINSTDKTTNTKLIVVLNKIRAPNDAKIVLSIKKAAQKQKRQPNQSVQSYSVKGQFGCVSFQIPQAEQDLQIKVDKFEPDQQYIYQLTFYFDSPRYSLKQRDRHLLFRYVSEYEERSKLDFDMLTQAEKQYFYQHFFLNANRKGVLCC